MKASIDKYHLLVNIAKEMCHITIKQLAIANIKND